MIFLFCEWFVIFEFYNNTEDGGMVMKEIMIETKALKKYYQMANNVVKALDGVDLQIGKREFVAIIGKSGSGKSTLLHMLGGLDIPSSGKVIIDGEDLSKLNHEQLAIFRRRKVGFVFQQYNLIPDLNVYENVVFPLQLDGRRIDDEFIETILTTLKIADKKEALPSMLSGGQQSHEVMLLLKILAKQYQQTIVIITHDYDIAQLADRIIQIEDGKIVQGSDDNA